MNDPKDVGAEVTEGWPIGVDEISLWKVVTVVGSDDGRWLVV